MINTVQKSRRAVGGALRQLLVGLGGAVLAFAAATLLHFVYGWSGGLRAAAVLGAANESVWEHIKILLWPYLIWSVAEYYLLLPDTRRFIVARTAGAYTLALLTVCVFYIYTGVLGRSVAWFDILSGFLWLLAAEAVSMRTLNARRPAGEYFIISLAALVLLVVMLLCFTVSPPQLGLFRDPVTGLYGMEVMP